jgi:hypothetical protein
MNNWLQAEASKQYARYKVTFPPPTLALKRHPNLDEVRRLLDPREGNIEFASLHDLAQRANQELAPRYAGRTSALINAGADEIVDAALATRNAIAHRSRRAVREMNQRVGAFPCIPCLESRRCPVMGSARASTRGHRPERPASSCFAGSSPGSPASSCRSLKRHMHQAVLPAIGSDPLFYYRPYWNGHCSWRRRLGPGPRKRSPSRHLRALRPTPRSRRRTHEMVAMCERDGLQAVVYA